MWHSKEGMRLHLEPVPVEGQSLSRPPCATADPAWSLHPAKWMLEQSLPSPKCVVISQQKDPAVTTSGGGGLSEWRETITEAEYPNLGRLFTQPAVTGQVYGPDAGWGCTQNAGQPWPRGALGRTAHVPPTCLGSPGACCDGNKALWILVKIYVDQHGSSYDTRLREEMYVILVNKYTVNTQCMCSSAMTKEVIKCDHLKTGKRETSAHNAALVYLLVFPGGNTENPTHHHQHWHLRGGRPWAQSWHHM